MKRVSQQLLLCRQGKRAQNSKAAERCAWSETPVTPAIAYLEQIKASEVKDAAVSLISMVKCDFVQSEQLDVVQL